MLKAKSDKEKKSAEPPSFNLLSWNSTMGGQNAQQKVSALVDEVGDQDASLVLLQEAPEEAELKQIHKLLRKSSKSWEQIPREQETLYPGAPNTGMNRFYAGFYRGSQLEVEAADEEEKEKPKPKGTKRKPDKALETVAEEPDAEEEAPQASSLRRSTRERKAVKKDLPIGTRRPQFLFVKRGKHKVRVANFHNEAPTSGYAPIGMNRAVEDIQSRDPSIPTLLTADTNLKKKDRRGYLSAFPNVVDEGNYDVVASTSASVRVKKRPLKKARWTGDFEGDHRPLAATISFEDEQKQKGKGKGKGKGKSKQVEEEEEEE
ncbi:MAG: hypothetical protein QM820_44550 [Minicystis sp.]